MGLAGPNFLAKSLSITRFSDSNGLTPYRLANQIGKKKLLLCFKSFRKTFPEKYDYEKAGVSHLPPVFYITPLFS